MDYTDCHQTTGSDSVNLEDVYGWFVIKVIDDLYSHKGIIFKLFSRSSGNKLKYLTAAGDKILQSERVPIPTTMPTLGPNRSQIHPPTIWVQR